MSTLREMLRQGDPLSNDIQSTDELPRIRRAVVSAPVQRPIPDAPRLWTRRRVLATTGVLALVALGLLTRFGVGTGVLQAAVRFEVRLAEEQPGVGLTEARVRSSGRLIYLHGDVIVANEDISGTNVVAGNDPSTFWVAVNFNQAGSQRMEAATAGHLDKPIAIVLDGEVVMAPIVRGPISDSALITGTYTRAEAQRLAEGIERQ